MKIKQSLMLAATFSAACTLLIFPTAAATGARNGIGYCLQILVPSLYPFMVLSVFVVKSGLSEKIGKLFEAPARSVLKLPGSTAATILMSMIGGYPTGARSVAALYEIGSINEKQAARMLCFCVNSGPAFVISAVGAGFLKSQQAGIILFVSQILACIILSLICGINEKKEPASKPMRKTASQKAANALIASVNDAARAMIAMCCFVVLFAALLNLLRLWVKSPQSAALLSGLLEITGGCSDFAKLGMPLWAVSFILGWGGICVHFQVLSSVEKIKVGLPRFLFFRLLHGIFAALITVCLVQVFPISEEAFHNTTAPLAANFSGSIPASTALIVLCIAFVFSIPHKKVEIEEC